MPRSSSNRNRVGSGADEAAREETTAAVAAKEVDVVVVARDEAEVAAEAQAQALEKGTRLFAS